MEAKMRNGLLTLLCSAVVLMAVTGYARSETVGRYECNVIGAVAQEPIGNGHTLSSLQYSCVGVDGVLKGAVVTAVSSSEWDGPKGTYIASMGIHRAPGGFAIGQLTWHGVCYHEGWQAGRHRSFWKDTLQVRIWHVGITLRKNGEILHETDWAQSVRA